LGTGNPKTVSPTTTTVYTVTGTNANGCTNTATTTVTVNPLPSAEAGRDTIIYNGDSIQIGSIPIAGYTYHWSPSTGLNNTNIANPWAKPAVSRYYYVTVTNTVGCTNKDSIKIGVALKMKCAASDFLNQALLNDTINEKLNTYENVISNYISTHFHAKQMWNEFTIPVVVNVINLGEPVGTGTNISDLQIISQIDALNRDFSNSASSINQYASNTHVHFCLAQIPPTGYTWPGTPGIMRYTDASASDHHMNQVGWNLLAGYGFPSNNYFNIWVVNSITDQYSTPGIQGYATMPGVPVTNIITGVVIVNQIFGDNSLYSNCPNCYNLSLINEAGKIASHEVGHFLGLYHTFDSMFGGGIACINANSTNDCTYLGDKCCDTPPELNANYGFTTINSCNTDDIPNAGGLNPYYPSTDANDMIENYMDYSPDDIRNTFTTEQGQRIQAVLAVYPTRYNLCTLDNLVYTGVDGLTGCMEPDLFSYFNVVQNTYCLNLNGPLSFTFTPSLGNGATHWNWTFAGGNPTIANNTTAAPVTVTYTTEGNYTVSLTVTDDDNNNDVFEQSINVTNCNEIETSCSNPCYGNLIVNGDFQDNTWLANTNNPYNGVNTEYTCTSQGMLVTGPNKANICNSTTVQADNSGWLCNDHDGLPNGNFWVVDGQSDALIMPPVIEAWGQVIPQASFIPNTAYTFSFWVNNIIKPTLNSYNFDPTLPQIQLKVNGSIVDFDNVNYPSNTAYIHLIPDNWVQLCYSFTTPNTPIAMNFVIQSCNPEGNGDDFALDDITLTPHMTITDKIGNETCFGSQDGVIYIFVTDGTSPYTYNWANSNGPFTPVDPTALTNLSADNYTVTATDANGCSVSESIVIGNSVTSAWPYNPYNGTSKELGSSVAVNTNVGDHDFGDVYSVGYFDGNIAFDNSLPNTYTTNGGKDIFISKFDACGDLLWSKQIGGSGADMVNKVIVDYNGDIIITGYFSNSINFGGGTRTVVGYPTSTTDLFVAKYLKDGTYSWDYTFDHNSLGLQDVGNDLVLDHTGSYVYAVGTVGASGLTGNIYVAKINETNGILSSSYTYNSSTAKGLGITYCNACGTNSKILVTGQVAGNIILYTWDAGLTTLTPNYYNITGAGQHIVSNANYAYIAGYKDVSGNHQIELITAGLSTLGTPNVITCGSALGYDAATDIQLDQNGDVFITGQFTSNPAEFPIGSGNNVYNSADPCTPPCTNDNFVAKYSVTGNVFDWISHSGSSDDETSIGMSLIGNGFGYITGGFQNSATFGSIILTASADQDMFIARIHDLGPTHGQFEKLTANDNSNNAEDNISIYPNPTNDKLNIDLSFVTDTKTKILLCDLVGNTVKVIDEGVFSKRHITTDTYNLANGVYLVKFELADKTVIKKLAIIK